MVVLWSLTTDAADPVFVGYSTLQKNCIIIYTESAHGAPKSNTESTNGPSKSIAIYTERANGPPEGIVIYKGSASGLPENTVVYKESYNL